MLVQTPPKDDHQTSFISKYFISPRNQLILANSWNASCGWGFTSEDFDSLDQVPECPARRLTSVVLEISLDTVEETFNAAVELIRVTHPSFRVSREIRSDLEHLRLIATEHRRGLRWRTIDLGSDWRPGDQTRVRPGPIFDPAKYAAHVALWSAVLFPKWIDVLGKDAPNVWLPGYEVNQHCEFDKPDEKKWSRRPFLERDHVSNQLQLCSAHQDCCYFGFAVPTLIS